MWSRIQRRDGTDLGRAYLGHAGTETASDFTVIGDVANTEARLQSRVGPGQIALTEDLGGRAQLGEQVELTLEGKAEPVAARIVTVDAAAVA